MANLAVQQMNAELFPELPDVTELMRLVHRTLAAAIRRVWIDHGWKPPIVVVAFVVDVYLISIEAWDAYCRHWFRKKMMAAVDELVGPWMEKSKTIGQSDKEQGALLDEMLAEFAKTDPRFLHFARDKPQSIEESDMPLNSQDKLDIAKIVAEQLCNHKFSFEKMSYSNKSIATIIGAAVVIGGAILTGCLFINNSFNGLREEIHQQNGHVLLLENTIKERLPARPVAFTVAPTSAGSGSSTPPTTTNGSPSP